MTDCKKCKVKRECEDLAEMGIIDMTCKEVEEYAKVGSEESDDSTYICSVWTAK